MLLYHGTNLSNWEKIKSQGLVPRGKSGTSNWEHSIESNPDTVYLGSAYAPYFALCSANEETETPRTAVVIEVDMDDLDPRLMVPDEDALEQAFRWGDDGLPKHWNMIERTRHYRSKTLEYRDAGLDHLWSLSVLGTMGYLGKIPPSAFRRVALIDVKLAYAVSWEFLNAQVSVNNFRFVGKKYINLTKALFGDPVEPVEGLEFMAPPVVGPGVTILNLEEV